MKAYKDKKTIILFLLPAIVLMSVFVYFPLIQSAVFSLYKWAAFSPQKEWIGFQNYITVFNDPVTLLMFKNNTMYAFWSTLFQAGLGLVFAACLEEAFMRRSQYFFRTVLFIPSVISMTVIGLLWSFLFNPNIGVINEAIRAMGFTEFNAQWLGDSKLAIYCCIFVSQWQYIGYCMLLDLIAIQKIPAELFESATIDGAGSMQRFIHITLPLVREAILVSTVITILGSYKVFTEVYVMTTGGPGRSSEVLATAMYRAAFKNDEMGVACALSIIIFIITFIFAAIQLKISRSGKE